MKKNNKIYNVNCSLKSQIYKDQFCSVIPKNKSKIVLDEKDKYPQD